MDKIWDRKSFEVGGHCPLWRGWKNRMTTQNRQKANAKIFFLYIYNIISNSLRDKYIGQPGHSTLNCTVWKLVKLSVILVISWWSIQYGSRSQLVQSRHNVFVSFVLGQISHWKSTLLDNVWFYQVRYSQYQTMVSNTCTQIKEAIV